MSLLCSQSMVLKAISLGMVLLAIKHNIAQTIPSFPRTRLKTQGTAIAMISADMLRITELPCH